MSRDIAFYIVDIFIAADKIKRYTQNFMEAKSFLHDELAWDATIRELEIIGEATNRLLKENLLDTSHRIIVDFRNQIIHGYFGIDEEIVWEVITTLLDPFLETLSSLVREHHIDLSNAISSAKEDHYYNPKTLKLLNSLLQR